MKYLNIFYLISFILFFLSCKNEKTKNDLTEKKLSGQVKTLIVTEYETNEKFGEIEHGRLISKYSYKFNEKGKINEVEKYFSYDNRYSTDIMKYDRDDNKVEEKEYNKDGSVNSITIFSYDNLGNIINYETHNSDSSIYSKYDYKYDESGFQIEKNSYDTDGSLASKSKYKYDKEGNVVEENYYRSDGTLFLNTTYKYDSNNNQIELVCYSHHSKSEVSRVTNKYDSNNNEIENISYRSDGSIFFKQITTYDKIGNRIEWKHFDSDGNLSTKRTYKFVYDKNSNWTEEISFVNDKHEKIIQRDIEYY